MMSDSEKNHTERLSADEQFRLDLQSAIQNLNKEEFEAAKLDLEAVEFAEELKAAQTIAQNILQEELSYWAKVLDDLFKDEQKEKVRHALEEEKKQLESIQKEALNQLLRDINGTQETLSSYCDAFQSALNDYDAALEERSNHVKGLEVIRNQIIRELFSDQDKLLESLVKTSNGKHSQSDLEKISGILSSLDDDALTQYFLSLDTQEQNSTQHLLDETGMPIPPLPSDDRLFNNASTQPAKLLAQLVLKRMKDEGYESDHLTEDDIASLIQSSIQDQLNQNEQYQEKVQAIKQATQKCVTAKAKMDELAPKILREQERLNEKRAKYEKMIQSNPKFRQEHDKLNRIIIQPRLQEIARQQERNTHRTAPGISKKLQAKDDASKPQSSRVIKSPSNGELKVEGKICALNKKAIVIGHASLGTRTKPGNYRIKSGGKYIYEGDKGLTEPQKALLQKTKSIEYAAHKCIDEVNKRWLDEMFSTGRIAKGEMVYFDKDPKNYKVMKIQKEDKSFRDLTESELSMYQKHYRDINQIAKEVFSEDPNLRGLKATFKVPQITKTLASEHKEKAVASPEQNRTMESKSPLKKSKIPPKPPVPPECVTKETAEEFRAEIDEIIRVRGLSSNLSNARESYLNSDDKQESKEKLTMLLQQYRVALNDGQRVILDNVLDASGISHQDYTAHESYLEKLTDYMCEKINQQYGVEFLDRQSYQMEYKEAVRGKDSATSSNEDASKKSIDGESSFRTPRS